MGPWTDRWVTTFKKMGLLPDECYYCREKSLYNQPHNETGEIIDVCKKHFVMDVSE